MDQRRRNLVKRPSLSQSYTLDESQLSNEFHVFMGEWSNELGISPSQLLTRIVLDAIEGAIYVEKAPDWCPFRKEEEEEQLRRKQKVKSK